MPKSSKAIYSKPPPNTIFHPYGYKLSLGGIILIDPNTYIKMNGFSTDYWGWGFEDTDFMLRAMLNEVKILRENFTKRYKSEIYYELDIQSDSDFANKSNRISARVNEILFYNNVLNPKKSRSAGFNTTDYTVLDKKTLEKYTNIRCKIHNTNRNLCDTKRLSNYISNISEN